jgi:amino acid transporter
VRHEGESIRGRADRGRASFRTSTGSRDAAARIAAAPKSMKISETWRNTSWRNLFFGAPISTEEDEGERIGPIAGVGVLGLDALASAAYGPEALLTVLLPLGAAGLRHLAPLTTLIGALLVVVALSYRQTIHAYPDGGGAYTVAKENLGTRASLFAAAALALDYMLNVAVGISAGVGALVSAVPSLLPHTLLLCLCVLAILTFINLRGVRATGLVFLLPTYSFLGTLFIVIGIGATKMALEGGHPSAVVMTNTTSMSTGTASVWLLMRAFANGCTAMTGVEAVSNGTPLFFPPTEKGARRTLAAIVSCLVLLLAGVALLAIGYGVTATSPGEPGYESILSRLTAAVVGRGPFYYFTIASIVAVLAFSANTSFADFPRVCRMLAADRFLPEPFVHRGRRLAFSHGIIVLAVVSAILLIVFGGITDALIPLFAVGALSAFTVSQWGMIAHWRKRAGEASARRAVALNTAGAVATGATLFVVLLSKFHEGAWISVALAVSMYVLFKNVRAHYDFVGKATATTQSLVFASPRRAVAVVPMRRWDAVALKAMQFGIGFADSVIAVQVLTGDRDVDDLTNRWQQLAVEPARAEGRAEPQLVVLRSQYRQLYAPLLDFVRRLEREHEGRPIAVIVPELVEPRWYHHLLHNHTASMMKTLLLFRSGPQTIIVNIPFHLRDWKPERHWLRQLRSSRLNGSRFSGAR